MIKVIVKENDKEKAYFFKTEEELDKWYETQPRSILKRVQSVEFDVDTKKR